MTPFELFLIAMFGLCMIGTILCIGGAYKQGWTYGYRAGYDDRDDEIFNDEPRGTRRGKTRQ